MCPPPLGKLDEFAEMFQDGKEKSMNMAKNYKEIAEKYGCRFLDTVEVIKTSDVDGIHFDLSEHIKLGKFLTSYVKKIFE
jgi:hypothetical protein